MSPVMMKDWGPVHLFSSEGEVREAVNAGQIEENPERLAYAYEHMAVAVQQLGDYETAFVWHGKSLHILENFHAADRSGSFSCALGGRRISRLALVVTRWVAITRGWARMTLQCELDPPFPSPARLCSRFVWRLMAYACSHRDFFRSALVIFTNNKVPTESLLIRTQYKLGRFLVTHGHGYDDVHVQEGLAMVQAAQQGRLALKGIPPDVDDCMEAYDKLVPYWAW
jgi:hypothetical protein